MYYINTQINRPIFVALFLTLLLLFSPGWVGATSSETIRPRGISSTDLVHWILSANSDVEDRMIEIEAAQFRAEAQKGLYEPVWFSRIEGEQERRIRSTTEYSLGDMNAKHTLAETSRDVESGLKFPLPTGGEAVVNYQFSRLKSNLFPDQIDNEYNSRLDLSLNQPLLRNAGRRITETGKRVAMLQEDESHLLYRQQMMQTAAKAAQLYWQLYRVHEVVQIRQAALETAVKLQQDMELRVLRGSAAQTALLETRAAIADRQAELARAQQVMSEVLTSIRISLNLKEGALSAFHLQPVQQPDFSESEDIPLQQRIDYALLNHPEYLVLGVRQQTAQERLDYALNQQQVKLDLSGGYRFNRLDTNSSDAFNKTFDDNFQGWYAGLLLEVPLGRNIQARNTAQAERSLLNQARHRQNSLHNDLRNDIEGRLAQLKKAYDEVLEVEKSVDLHRQLLAVEMELFSRGQTRLRDVIEREMQFNDTRQRFVETAARVEIARIALMMSEGRLLYFYEVTDN